MCAGAQENVREGGNPKEQTRKWQADDHDAKCTEEIQGKNYSSA